MISVRMRDKNDVGVPEKQFVLFIISRSTQQSRHLTFPIGQRASQPARMASHLSLCQCEKSPLQLVSPARQLDSKNCPDVDVIVLSGKFN